MSTMSELHLVSKENITVECPLGPWIEHSTFVRNAFDESNDESIEIEELPVPNVKEQYIHQINSFFEIYQEEPYLPIPSPLPKNTMVLDFIQRRWSKWLIELSMDDVMELILCCNFLQLDILKQLLCAYIAGILQNVHRKNYGILGLNNPESEEKGQEEDEDEEVFHNPLELRKEQIISDSPYFDFRESNGQNFDKTFIAPELAAEIMKYGEPIVFPEEYII